MKISIVFRNIFKRKGIDAKTIARVLCDYATREKYINNYLQKFEPIRGTTHIDLGTLRNFLLVYRIFIVDYICFLTFSKDKRNEIADAFNTYIFAFFITDEPNNIEEEVYHQQFDAYKQIVNSSSGGEIPKNLGDKFSDLIGNYDPMIALLATSVFMQDATTLKEVLKDYS